MSEMTNEELAELLVLMAGGKTYIPADDENVMLKEAAARLRQQSEDSARLDHLQKEQKVIWRCTHSKRRYLTTSEPEWEWVEEFDGWAVNIDDEPMPTIREAIDKARK